MTPERVCELCSSGDFREVMVQAWQMAEAPLTLHICVNCNLVYCWPRVVDRPSATVSNTKPMSLKQGWPVSR